jgi:V8-like Glu-specific endopeptidase
MTMTMTIILLHLYFFVLVATSLTIIYAEAEENQIMRKQIRNQRRLRPIDNDNDYDYDYGTGDNGKYNTEKDDDFITGLQTYIVNGNDSSRGRYPYQAMLFRETGANARFGCGGSLIAPDIVLSAAHCGIPKQVEVGRDSRVEDNGNFDRRDVLYSYRHPRNDKQSYAYDMLLLKLSAPSTKRPIRLNDNPTLPIVNQLVTVTGFGKMAYNGVPSNTLREVELNAMSNDVCSSSKDLDSKRADFQRGYEGLIQDNMLCLSDLSGSKKDACSGDSGGPAILRGNTAEEDIQVGKLEEVHYIFDTVACHIDTHTHTHIYIYKYISDPFLLIIFVLFLFLKRNCIVGIRMRPAKFPRRVCWYQPQYCLA